MENIEIKLECRDLAMARSICRAHGAVFAGTFEQTDTYYRLARGRLKRRESPGEPPEYILYERADQARPRSSVYSVLTEAAARRKFGEAPLPEWVVVRKRRDVFLTGNVRIHLDSVEGLGDFVEFEAMVSRGCPAAKCAAAIAELREVLAPVLGEPVSLGYSDMVAESER